MSTTTPTRTGPRASARLALPALLVLGLLAAIVVQADETAVPEGPSTDLGAALERAYAAAAKEIAPCVVQIVVDRQGGGDDGGGGVNPAYHRRPRNGRCSGVIIKNTADRRDGNYYVITSSFNLEGNINSVEVTTAEGEVFDAEVLGRNEPLDLGLLKLVGPRRLPTPDLIDTSRDDALRVGQFVILVGRGENPLRHSVSTGVLSAVERQGQGALQFDAQCNYSNTGGALVNLRGELMGISTTIEPRVRHGLNSGVCFGMPWHLIEAQLVSLVAGEITTQPRGAFLGIQIGEPPIGVQGVQVTLVQPDTAAEDAGMENGDIIIEFDRKEILNQTDLRAALREVEPGDRVRVKVMRDGDVVTLQCTLGER